jgi:transcriptional regulator with XRE-family HTH domain
MLTQGQQRPNNHKESHIMVPNAIRDIREKKGLSQDAVAAAAGLTYSKFVRIEAGTGRTTEDEVKHVLSVLNKMKSTGKRVVGRPFADPKLQAAAQAARELGTSVSAVISGSAPATPVTTKAAPAKRTRATKKGAPATKKASKPRSRSKAKA